MKRIATSHNETHSNVAQCNFSRSNAWKRQFSNNLQSDFPKEFQGLTENKRRKTALEDYRMAFMPLYKRIAARKGFLNAFRQHLNAENDPNGPQDFDFQHTRRAGDTMHTPHLSGAKAKAKKGGTGVFWGVFLGLF
jgi:hypothetical protein